MPTMPRPARATTTTHWPAYRDNRSSTQRGYGQTWRRLREFVLSEERLCKLCTAKGLVTAANTVDHIRSKRAGGSDDRANLQALCTACHRDKTAHERGAAAPRLIITGAPGCGKSSWVHERAQPGDLVWDLDQVAATIGFQGRPLTAEQKGQLPYTVMKAVLVMRDALVHWLSLTPPKGAAVYLIVTDPREAHRLAQQIRGEVIDLSTLTMHVSEGESVIHG